MYYDNNYFLPVGLHVGNVLGCPLGIAVGCILVPEGCLVGRLVGTPDG